MCKKVKKAHVLALKRKRETTYEKTCNLIESVEREKTSHRYHKAMYRDKERHGGRRNANNLNFDCNHLCFLSCCFFLSFFLFFLSSDLLLGFALNPIGFFFVVSFVSRASSSDHSSSLFQLVVLVYRLLLF